MKLHELINYIDPNCDMELKVVSKTGVESVGKLKTLEPMYYELYRNYTLNQITTNEIRIIATKSKPRKRKKAVTTNGEELI